MPRSAAVLLVVLAAAGCTTSHATGQYTMTEDPHNMRTATAGQPAPLDPTRPISPRDCRNKIEVGGGNLLCE